MNPCAFKAGDIVMLAKSEFVKNPRRHLFRVDYICETEYGFQWSLTPVRIDGQRKQNGEYGFSGPVDAHKWEKFEDKTDA